MSKKAFHYEQRRLENNRVALEIFNVCWFYSLEAILNNCLEYIDLTVRLYGAVAKRSRSTFRRSDQSQPESLYIRTFPYDRDEGRFHERVLRQVH